MSESKYRARVIASGKPDPGSSISKEKYATLKAWSKYNRVMGRLVRDRYNPKTKQMIEKVL